jgi:hypothetical protein
MNFLEIFSKNVRMSNFMKICPLGAEVFACEVTDRHDKAIYSFSQFCEIAYKLLCLRNYQLQEYKIKIISHVSMILCSVKILDRGRIGIVYSVEKQLISNATMKSRN